MPCRLDLNRSPNCRWWYFAIRESSRRIERRLRLHVPLCNLSTTLMSTEPNKVIYSMVGVSKFYDKKPVLKDIYLSYFYGAKIGVIGLNGSGKSSLLRILAGVDKEFNGETVISPGFTVGYLEQEPLIDDTRTVRAVVEQAVQETVDLLKEFEDINAKFGEEMSDDEMNALLER